MSALTMAFVPGVKYRFTQKLRSNVIFGPRIEQPSEYSNHAARTLTFLRDECGDRRATGQRVIHHIFQWGAVHWNALPTSKREIMSSQKNRPCLRQQAQPKRKNPKER